MKMRTSALLGASLLAVASLTSCAVNTSGDGAASECKLSNSPLSSID